MFDFQTMRQAMVDGQLRSNQVTDQLLLEAFHEIPRELFVPDQKVAYVDDELYFSSGRFMLRPMVLARLIQALALKPKDNVLVIGCTTGYSLMLLKNLAVSVTGLESDAKLVDQALDLLTPLPKFLKNIVKADLWGGTAQKKPYQAILIEGGVQRLPEELFTQLAEGGRMAYIEWIQEKLGKATTLLKQDGLISKRSIFDCAPCPLPEFSLPTRFVF
ncbi:MAG: protein-L-isoaspartate O-methyltransferase [Alphaproteobacteria bacterium]|nr:protein-L-isoaspartate O-methyltransferase [Alphaproteobacteria bacterium]